jgi:hypothetical protein
MAVDVVAAELGRLYERIAGRFTGGNRDYLRDVEEM